MGRGAGPALATAVAGAVAVAVLLLGGGLYYNARLAGDAAARRAEQQAAVDARAAVEQRNLALKALDQLVFDVQERLAQTPATRSLRRSLLDTAIRGLDEIARSTAGVAPRPQPGGRPPEARRHLPRHRPDDTRAGIITCDRWRSRRALAGAPEDPPTREVVYQAQMGLGLVEMRTQAV